MEKFCLIAVAAGCLLMGCRLFAQAKEKQGQICLSLNRHVKLSLRDMAPGIYFSAFGSVLLVFVLLRVGADTPRASKDSTSNLSPDQIRALISAGKDDGPNARALEASKPRNSIEEALHPGEDKGSNPSGDDSERALKDLKARVLGDPKSHP